MENFGTSSGQSWIVLRVSFDPGIDIFGFYCVLQYHNGSVMNGTKNGLWQ